MSQKESWQERLNDEIYTDDLREQIDVFARQIALRQQNKVDEKVFAETRLRRGVYGQRYDNGRRHDGIESRQLAYAERPTKGPETLWDAPGMQRIKLPFGGITPKQLEVFADVAEEYSDSILHITTRQDIQLHFVHIEDTPDMMRRLGAVGITTHEACGNAVRNITACPIAGVCKTEAFDVTPYADALTYYLLGHDDAQDFGRKFKIAFSGCAQEACGLVTIHDMGFLAQTRQIEGQTVHGFRVYVGGGLGTVPYPAKVLEEFIAADEMLPTAQAVCRIYARMGEKRNRNRARIKFLVAQLGIEAFQALVREERANLPTDERWTRFAVSNFFARNEELPMRSADSAPLATQPISDPYLAWRESNVTAQRQDGYYTVTVSLPLGDLTSQQAYRLADIGRTFVGDYLRTTVEQNIVLRWVAEVDLPALYDALDAVGLAEAGAGTIVDITSCPGTDTCKLGIAASRGLSRELKTRLQARNASLPLAVKNLRVKVSGCFNSCGQHHIADIGFFGNSRRRDGRAVPHFQLVLGGEWRNNGGSYGMTIGAIPSKVVPDALDLLVTRYAAERQGDEPFISWVNRLGKVAITQMIKPLQEVPAHADDPRFYTDWGDVREFSLGDMGVGECAGEVVSLFSFEISKAEAVHFDALVAHEAGDYVSADLRAYQAMVAAAKAVVRIRFLDVGGDDPNTIVQAFRTRFYDTELFFDPYAKGKFAHYLFDRHNNPPTTFSVESTYQQIEQAQLFIEACHACDARLAGLAVGGTTM